MDALAPLFPEDVVAVEASPAMWGAPLLPEEEPAVARAVAKRQREFRAGRACAREALRRLGVPPGPLPVGRDRGPRWPAGVVGSITHTEGFCAAAVARAADLLGLGLDAERTGRVGEKLVPRIATPLERDWMQGSPPAPDGCDWATLVFSAKETLYKALRGVVPGPLGFQDAWLPEAPRAGRFRIVLRPPRRPAALPPELPDALEGRFLVRGPHVITALALARGPGGLRSPGP